ncbi:MmcQ/YjbR family DNA-binding protein [Sulfitobacter noctilucicola]|nr:MmcQ/YjbR family DNA-binding protein [Sulfitobacter noctilucicola]
MTRSDIDRICAAFPGATEAHPPELVSWKIGGKMFACFGGDGEMNGVSVKTDSTDTAAMLIEASAAVRAPYFHKSWVRLPFDSSDTEEARHRLAVSYDIVRASLRKSDRDALPVREAI